MNVEQLRHLLRAAASITWLVNRGRILRLIEAEKDDELKDYLTRNWTIATASKSL